MGMKRLIAAAFCAAALVTVPAGGAFAGEVKGPPGTLNNTNETGALDHANSACAASGLNDFDLSDPMGQPRRRSRPPPTPGGTTDCRTARRAGSASAAGGPGSGRRRVSCQPPHLASSG